MSWHYSLAQEGGFSLASYLDGLRSERLRSNPTLATSCSSDNERAFLNASLSGTTSAPSTASLGEGSSMSSAEGFPARTSPRQVREQDWPEAVVVFGLSICESLKSLGLDLSSPKTALFSVPVALAPSSKDLQRWGMMLDGVCWGLGTSAIFTDGTGCGSLLATVVKSDCNGTAKNRYRGSKNYRGAMMSESLRTCCEDPLYTHPSFAEEMMGWPTGWTERKPLEMDKFLSWLQQHGGF